MGAENRGQCSPDLVVNSSELTAGEAKICDKVCNRDGVGKLRRFRDVVRLQGDRLEGARRGREARGGW